MGKMQERKSFSVTKFLLLYLTTMASIWVSATYIIAGYATIKFGQAFPVEELSKTAITALLVPIIAKVVGNVFEHNSGAIFGTSDNTNISTPSSV